MTSSGDTIFALSSAPGRAGVTVFRVSGPAAAKTFMDLTKRPCPAPRQAKLRTIYGESGVIDEALVLYMPGPNSFTGEDIAEFQTHGSLAVIDAMGECLARAGARPARAGEFTRRAVLNGRMDLTEAEGLADLIDAETEGQRRQAVRQMQGGLRETYEDWRNDLIEALAMIEGEIDFPDEGDVPEALARRAGPILKKVQENMQLAMQTAGRGETVRAGLDIAIIGAPNAGKSSIINRLAGIEAAIVSSIAGTTRDIVDVQLTLAGLPVRLSDTAGLRTSEDEIEAEGIRRAVNRAKHSDICIYVYDASLGTEMKEFDKLTQTPPRVGDIILANKSDLVRPEPVSPAKEDECVGLGLAYFAVSAKTGMGFDALRAWIEAEIIERFSPADLPGLTRSRHIDCVTRAMFSVERAQDNLKIAAELAGEDLRSALHAIRELAGETDMEAVFDHIFSRFCIGK